MKKGNEMRPIPYNITMLVGVLLFAFLTTPSFGSTNPRQNDETHQPREKRPFIMASAEEQLPHDVRVHILSFLSKQKDLLRIGAVSKSWRKAAGKLWEKRPLDLSGRLFKEADYQVLARGIFPHLSLCEVDLNVTSARILAAASHLRTLELAFNQHRATQELLPLLTLPMLPNLMRLGLAHYKIGHNGAEALAKAFKERKSLKELALSFDQIGHAEITVLAPALKDITALKSLSIDYNQIENRGLIVLAPTLKEMTALTQLDLSANQFGDAGITALAPALKAMTALTSLSLSSNWFGDAGATVLAQSLKGITSIIALNLFSNLIGVDGKRALEELKQVRPSLKINY